MSRKDYSDIFFISQRLVVKSSTKLQFDTYTKEYLESPEGPLRIKIGEVEMIQVVHPVKDMTHEDIESLNMQEGHYIQRRWVNEKGDVLVKRALLYNNKTNKGIIYKIRASLRKNSSTTKILDNPSEQFFDLMIKEEFNMLKQHILSTDK